MLARLKNHARTISKTALDVTSIAMALSAIQLDARPPSNEEEQNKAAVQKSFDAWHAGTGSPYDLLADDVRWTIEGNSVASKTYPTKEDFMREVIRPFNARMQSPLKPVIRNLYADNNTVVVFFDAKGIARDGRPYANTYAWFLDMRAGHIIRASAFFDAIEFNDLWSRVKPAHGH